MVDGAAINCVHEPCFENSQDNAPDNASAWHLMVPFYYAWGAMHTWMVFLGGEVYSWYPSVIYNDAWWKT
jgi:hypothetical protein